MSETCLCLSVVLICLLRPSRRWVSGGRASVNLSRGRPQCSLKGVYFAQLGSLAIRPRLPPWATLALARSLVIAVGRSTEPERCPVHQIGGRARMSPLCRHSVSTYRAPRRVFGTLSSSDAILAASTSSFFFYSNNCSLRPVCLRVERGAMSGHAKDMRRCSFSVSPLT